MRRRRHNSGFVLIIVLLVIVIASTALAATVRHSCQQALRAAEKTRNLQRRWGALSCRAVALPRAELTLADRSETERGPLAVVRDSVTLGRMTFTLVVGDEQAKANVNLLTARHGKRGLREALRSLQLDQRRVLRTRLQPSAVAPDPAEPMATLYGSFEQLFAITHPSDLVGAGGGGVAGRSGPGTAAQTIFSQKYASDRITCWSNGKVNFKRGDRRVLRRVLDGVLNETHVDALIRIRDDVPNCTLGEALDQLELEKDARNAARELLTDMSWCHSLWIIVDDGVRTWHELHIAGAATESEDWSFAW